MGYLTARPWSHTPGIAYESIGKVESEDGLDWRAVAPPVFDWGPWPRINLYEAVGLAKIGGVYYLLMAYSATGNLGDRHDQRHIGSRHGMYTFIAESP